MFCGKCKRYHPSHLVACGTPGQDLVLLSPAVFPASLLVPQAARGETLSFLIEIHCPSSLPSEPMKYKASVQWFYEPQDSFPHCYVMNCVP